MFNVTFELSTRQEEDDDLELEAEAPDLAWRRTRSLFVFLTLAYQTSTPPVMIPNYF
jgi:hypothetical protein